MPNYDSPAGASSTTAKNLSSSALDDSAVNYKRLCTSISRLHEFSVRLSGPRPQAVLDKPPQTLQPMQNVHSRMNQINTDISRELDELENLIDNLCNFA